MGHNTSTIQLKLSRFSAKNRGDFNTVQCTDSKNGWCQCVAWWVPTWQGFSDRTAEENLQLRDQLCDRGEYDGYILYVDTKPTGWVQAGPRDRLSKLTEQYKLKPDPDVWAVTCFVIKPDQRGRGFSAYMLLQVLAVARRAGVKRLESYPRQQGGQPEELWTGPLSVFEAAGFKTIQEDPGPVMSLDL